MSSKQLTTLSLLRRLISHIGRKRLMSILLLQILSLFSSLVEALSVGAIVPFITLIGYPEKAFNNNKIRSILNYFSISNDNLVFYITILFILLVLLSAILKWTMIFFNTRMSNEIGSKLSCDLYKRSLYEPYIVHTKRNSSEILAGVNKANDLVNLIILPFFLMINSFFTLVLLTSVLIYLNPFIIISSFIGISLFYFLLMNIVKRKLLFESFLISERKPLLFKILQEGLGGIRDILIDGSQSYYSDLYYLNEKKFKESQAKIILINTTPNIAIQSFGICIIAFFAFYTTKNGNMDSTLPFLGALAFGYLRISPALQQIYSSWTNLKSGQVSLSYVINFLGKPLPEYANKPIETMEFKDKIILENISFQYNEDLPYIFENLNLNINKGDKVGLIGTTGSGKSTLIDIIMSLLTPTNGNLKIDDIIITDKNFRSWQSHIAHVPQSIFLSDNSILENIAFGIPKSKIDYNRVIEAAKKAQIFETIDKWEHKFETLIGERGVRLSGGQRQRIGIARALYKKADVIVLDEATSALDGDTETDVMKSIDLLGSDLTILIIAHRITTLKNCNVILELVNGKLIQNASYENLITLN